MSKNDILSILGQVKITDVVKISKCEGGAVSNVYEVSRKNNETFIVKIFSKRFNKNRIKASVIAQILLAKNNLAPKIYMIQGKLWMKYKDNYVVFMEKIIGINEMSESKDIYVDGELLGKVHNILKDLRLHPKPKYLRTHSYLYSKIVFKLLQLKYRGTNQMYLGYLKIQSVLLDHYYYNRKLYEKKQLIYTYIHGDYRKSNILQYNHKNYVIDMDQISIFPRTYEIYKYIFQSVPCNSSLGVFKAVLFKFLSGYQQYGRLTTLELLHGFSFYYYTYISDNRCYIKKYKVKDNDEYLNRRIEYCTWFNEEYDEFIEIIKSYGIGDINE